ncbi:MAG: N-acetyltransferase [Gammaproteobacteria bacterium]|nr:N-acetyltransferase [Gammaproteobacteria bacterium]
MRRIDYVRLDEVDPAEFVTLLNKKRIREHLVEHQQFTVGTAAHWIKTKDDESSRRCCRIRAVFVDDQLSGWCGIQPDGIGYELAIVIDKSHWGLGPRIFRDVMGWASELGHEVISIHLLHTRPEYKFLHKMARNVYSTELLGDRFTTYELAVK